MGVDITEIYRCGNGYLMVCDRWHTTVYDRGRC